MKYIQPYGISDPDAPYINGDPSIARQGSIPPAEAFEHPMRELVAVIADSMIAPSSDDLEQVAKGIRSQRMNYVDDTGSANTLSVAFDPPLTSYSIGLPIRVKIKVTNTGPSTIDAGAGRVSVKKPTGAEMAAGDLPAAGLAEMVYDGTNFQMINFGGAGGGTGSVYLVNIPYCVDTGTVNNVVANFSPAITSLQAGTIFMVKIANTNTTFANINVNGLGQKQIYAQGGNASWPLLPSDMVAGDVLVFVYDGTRFWIYANTILNQTANFTVSNNAQFDSLFDALGRKRILTSGNVNITLATGIYNPLRTQHPNAERVNVIGTMLAARPTFGDFQKTGSSPAARANDSANNIAMLRTRYGTEVRFTNVANGSSVGISHTGAGQINFTNILITGANVDAGASEIATAALTSSTNSGGIACYGCTVWGSGFYGYVSNGGVLTLVNCYSCGNFGDGIASVGGGSTFMQECGFYGNARSGVWAQGGQQTTLWQWSGIPGVPDLLGNQVIGNGQYGVLSLDHSEITVKGTTNVTGNGLDAYCANESLILLDHGSAYGTVSPAIGVAGNNNAIIVAY